MRGEGWRMMLKKLVPMDDVFGWEAFKADEVPYNLLHLIGAAPETPSFKSPDGRMIFARSARGNAWLWMQEAVPAEVRGRWLQELVHQLGEAELPGVTGEPGVAEHFARLYTEAHDRSYRCLMTMEAYHCPVVRRPQQVNGSLRKAAAADSQEVARFLAGFSEDAYGVRVQAEDRRETAERLIEQGGLYLWTVEGSPVSMAH
ncbi:GNAT family N-acetyltransferase [Paenibacillus lactis]|uniref:GNAT family N-acetyltransferase n=2 Tax=Paenibacillus TaxID=44249 RepID=UPI0021B61DDE